MSEKFLVIQTAFIGDVVLATAIVESLHEAYPDARIDFLLRKGAEGLLNGHPYLHELLVWDKKKNKLPNLWKLLRRVRRNRYDKVINVQRYAATGLITACSGARETIGFDKNPFSFFFTTKVKHVFSGYIKKAGRDLSLQDTQNAGRGEAYAGPAASLTVKGVQESPGSHSPLAGELSPVHEIERNNALIHHFTHRLAGKPALYPTAKDDSAVAGYTIHPYITISPASVWFTKQYPAQKWADFMDRVPAVYTLYLLGGREDAGLAEEIREKTLHPSVVNLCGKLDFLQSAALMRDALMNYTNDSAPMHFASAVNAPVTAVYCSTIPAFGYGPLSDKHFIVEKKEPLYCRPCGLHGYRACPQGHFRCAADIRDEQLLETIGLGA